MERVSTLFTAQELEGLLGKKYFYRQGIYRLAEEGRISAFQVSGVMYFSSQEVMVAVLKRLAERIRRRYPRISSNLRVKFGEREGKRITIYGFADGRKIEASTEQDSEEDLLNKLEEVREEVIKMPDIPVRPPHEPYDEPPTPPPPPPPHHGHGAPPPPHHFEVMEALRRIEERLARIEEKLG